MESRFSHIINRDCSVSMLRVKMSRRRSQSQKENRDRAVSQRRRLDKLSELEVSGLEVSAISQPSVIRQETAPVQNQSRSQQVAVEERRMMLLRYKEAKELRKEKERREKERKGGGVFKVGLYKPQPQLPAVPSRAKAAVPVQSSRVTRSMKQQQPHTMIAPGPQKGIVSLPRKVEPAMVKAPVTRAASKQKPAPAAGRSTAETVKSAFQAPTTRSTSNSKVIAEKKPLSVGGATTRGSSKQVADRSKGQANPGQGKTEVRNQKQKTNGPSEEMVPAPCPGFENKTEAVVPPQVPSFAPQGFLFQAPAGLKSFQSIPLTPRSTEAFLTPRYSSLSPGVSGPRVEPPDVPATPQPLTQVPPSPPSCHEQQHDVPYFRAVMAGETERLTALCEQWDVRTEDPSIPEEMRDRMWTAVGQARLLMKERFGQFEGLVDDCALGRGEKVITCSDLQGFWDMVYFQVEDVLRKFDALKEAESRGWKDEPKLRPRVRKTVKKPTSGAGPNKPAGEEGASAAAKSRLAAVKAAMKARQAANVEKANPPITAAEGHTDVTAPLDPPKPLVVFHGGFFKVESPAKLQGPLRRSSRLSGAPLHISSCTPKLTAAARDCHSAAHPSPVPIASSRMPHFHTQDGLGFPQPNLEDQQSGDAIQDAALQNGPPAARLAQDDIQSDSSCCHMVSSEPADCIVELRVREPEAVASQSQTEEVQEQSLTEQTAGQPNETTEVAVPLPIQSERKLDQDSSLLRSPCPNTNSSPTSRCMLSFTLSPCSPENAPKEGGLLAVSEPSLTAPEPLQSHHAASDSTQRPTNPAEDEDMSSTPDTSYVEYVTGPDFERYLQPSLRSSLSPRQPVTTEVSPMMVDAQVESLESWPGEQSGPGSVSHMASDLSVELFPLGQSYMQRNDQPLGSGLLLFTPEQTHKVRQSVCDRDLMMFTPPSSR